MADDRSDQFGYATDTELQRAEDRRRAQRGEQKPLRYQFEGMYEGRPELSGTPDFHRNWLNVNAPMVSRFRGRQPQKEYAPGRGFEEPRDWGPPQEQDISGVGNVRPSPGTPGTQFDEPLGIGPRSSYDLRNVRNSTTPGSSVMAGGASPSQSYAGGGGWERSGGMVGKGAPAIGSQGAMPRGSQFSGMVGATPSLGAAPRPFGELGPAGSSTYTYKTNPKGQMGWDL